MRYEIFDSTARTAEIAMGSSLGSDSRQFSVIGSDGPEQEVLLMRALPRSLGKPRELGSSSTGEIKLDSIAITPTTVNWTTTAGVRHTVPR
jgi:hypothetical protein